jgi:hypothetical protein
MSDPIVVKFEPPLGIKGDETMHEAIVRERAEFAAALEEIRCEHSEPSLCTLLDYYDNCPRWIARKALGLSTSADEDWRTK